MRSKCLKSWNLNILKKKKNLQVERAVKLFKEKIVEQKIDSRGQSRLGVRKMENPETGKSSGSSTDFSWENWHLAAQQYLQVIKKLDNERILRIINQAYYISECPGRRNPFAWVDSELLNSTRTYLDSDNEVQGTLADDGVDDTHRANNFDTSQDQAGDVNQTQMDSQDGDGASEGHCSHLHVTQADGSDDDNDEEVNQRRKSGRRKRRK